MKREFIINGFNCLAVLVGERLDVTIEMPHLTVTSQIRFRPLTPMGLRHQAFNSAEPERIAAQTIDQCRSIWITPTTATAAVN